MKQLIAGFQSIAISFSLWKFYTASKSSSSILHSLFWLGLRYQIADEHDEVLELLLLHGSRRLNNEASLYRYRKSNKQ
jgi:hypothetical protein